MQLSPELLDRLSQLSGNALFVTGVIVAFVGLYRRWWAPRSVLDEKDEIIKALRTENAAWRELYLALLTGKPHERRPFSARDARDDLAE